jgi:DNA-binding CsgD family transcriptional regulator
MRNGPIVLGNAATPMGAAPNWRDLNAFIYLDPEYFSNVQRSRSTGIESLPLSGFSLAIKDNIEVAGMPCTAGTPILRNYVPRVDAPAVARLRAAGGYVAGKANLHELAYGITSNNRAFERRDLEILDLLAPHLRNATRLARRIAGVEASGGLEVTIGRIQALGGLSARQSQIAYHAFLGNTDAEIADKLFISVATTRSHLRRVYRRLGVTNRVSLCHCLAKR